MAKTKKQVHSKGKQSEGRHGVGKQSAGAAKPTGQGKEQPVSRSKEQPAGQGKAQPVNQSKAQPAGRAASGRHDTAGCDVPNTLPKRRYTIACAVLGLVTAAGLVACILFRNAWGTALFFPLLGAALTALLWCSFARLYLCREPARLLSRHFTRAVRRALELPLWAGATALLCLLPAEVPEAVAILLLTVFLAAIPAAALMGVLSVCSAVRHLRAAPDSEPAIYREGPLVLAVLLFVAELAVLGWLAFYILL